MYQQQQSTMGYQTPNLQTSSSGDAGTGPSQTDDSGTGMRPEQEFGGNRDTNSNQGEQQQQPVQQPYAWGQPPFNQQWNWNLPQFGVQFQFPRTRIGQVYLRMTAGMSIHHSRIQIWLLIMLGPFRLRDVHSSILAKMCCWADRYTAVQLSTQALPTRHWS